MYMFIYIYIYLVFLASVVSLIKSLKNNCFNPMEIPCGHEILLPLPFQR